MSTLEAAISIATEAHKGLIDKAGQPYILHPLRVMFRVDSDEERIVAVLHDIMEDTPYTIDRLRALGFAEPVLTALALLTKHDGEPYEHFITRASENPLSRRVKLADLEDNMDIRRLETLSTKDAERLARYCRAWHRLRTM
jgi:(p)ppGpp synthase/HD superfamily hydrolase